MQDKYMAYVGSYSYNGQAKGITVYDDVHLLMSRYATDFHLRMLSLSQVPVSSVAVRRTPSIASPRWSHTVMFSRPCASF